MAEILAQGKFLQFIREDNWESVTRVNCSGVVIIIPITEDDHILLVEQYRPPVKKNLIELPAGLAGDGQFDGEDFSTAAIRELEEETGYLANSMEKVCQGPASAGVSDEWLNFYFAHDLTKTGDGGGDEHEDIIVHKIPIAGIHKWLSEQEALGKGIDIKIYTGLHFIARFKEGLL